MQTQKSAINKLKQLYKQTIMNNNKYINAYKHINKNDNNI